VPTNKQKREAARRHLERQLQRRQERDAARKRFTLIASVIGTVVLVVAVVVFVVAVTHDDKKKNVAQSPTPTLPTGSSASTTASTHYNKATGSTVTFNGVTVVGATDLKGYPQVTSKSSTPATKLETKDLVVGTGQAATPTSTVNVQYTGVLYSDGTEFDSSWQRGMPTSFPLTGVVPGFTQGIGGTTGVAPMKVGGRRIIIVPAALGYQDQQNGQIPPNSTLVFVVDLLSVSAAT
jgi:FKBP-type peptidyl-prolyl cis-trans isomerase